MIRNNNPNYVPDYMLEPPNEPYPGTGLFCENCHREILVGETYYDFGLMVECEECAESMMDNARRIAR